MMPDFTYPTPLRGETLDLMRMPGPMCPEQNIAQIGVLAQQLLL